MQLAHIGARIVSTTVLFGLVAIAQPFDFLNGLHDATNLIAIVVATGCCDPSRRCFGHCQTQAPSLSSRRSSARLICQPSRHCT